METFKIIADWNEFDSFIRNELHMVDQGSVGFMHRGGDIIVRSTEESILEIIRKKYELIPCKQPDIRGWGIRGNSSLFDVLPL